MFGDGLDVVELAGVVGWIGFRQDDDEWPVELGIVRWFFDDHLAGGDETGLLDGGCCNLDAVEGEGCCLVVELAVEQELNDVLDGEGEALGIVEERETGGWRAAELFVVVAEGLFAQGG